MGAARWIELSVVLAALSAAGPGLVRAQTLFPESDVLRRDTAVELAASDLTERSSTTGGGTAVRSDVDASLAKVGARLRLGVLAAGAAAEQRRYREETESYTQRDDRDQSAAYLGLALEGLFTDDDALYLVASTGTRDETFAFESTLRRLDSRVGVQAGLMYRLGVLIAGYLAGERELRLRVSDLALPAVDETYRFDYDALLAGLELGNPAEGSVLLLWERRAMPAVAGTAVNLEPGLEELRRVTLVLGALQLDYVRVYSRESFSGESLRELTERDVSLSVFLGERLSVGASQRRSKSRQDFTLLGQPTTRRAERTENLFSVGWRF